MKKADYLNAQNEILSKSIETRKATLENLSADNFDDVAQFEKAKESATKRLNEQVKLATLLTDEKVQNVLYKHKFDFTKCTFAKVFDTREFKDRFECCIKAIAYDSADYLRKYDDLFLRTVAKDMQANKELKYSRRKVHNEMRHDQHAKQTTQSNYFASFARELNIAEDDKASITFNKDNALFKQLIALYF